MRKLIGLPPTIVLTVLFFIILSVAVLVMTLSSTVLSFDFIKEELEETGTYSLAGEWLDENIEDFVPGLGELELYQVFRDSLDEEWLAEQVGGALDVISDYLDAERDTIEITLSIEGFKENMKIVLHDSVHESPPEGLKDLPEEQLDEYLEAAYGSIDELPGEITVVVTDASKLAGLRDVPDVLRGVVAILLLVTGLLAVLLLILHRFFLGSTPKVTCRFFGVLLFITGIFCFAIRMIVSNVGTARIESVDLPSPLTSDVVIQIANDSLAPATTYSVLIMVVGVVLVVASFFLPGRKSAKEA